MRRLSIDHKPTRQVQTTCRPVPATCRHTPITYRRHPDHIPTTRRHDANHVTTTRDVHAMHTDYTSMKLDAGNNRRRTRTYLHAHHVPVPLLDSRRAQRADERHVDAEVLQPRFGGGGHPQGTPELRVAEVFGQFVARPPQLVHLNSEKPRIFLRTFLLPWSTSGVFTVARFRGSWSGTSRQPHVSRQCVSLTLDRTS